MNLTVVGRLAALRREMKRRGIAMTLIPHADPHISEYMATHWHLREYFSGFTGSAGTLVVGLDKALLWTDSRYFLQASQQLAPASIELMKDGLPQTPSINEYICSHLSPGERVGIDGNQLSIAAEKTMREVLGASGIELDTTFAPVDEIWLDRPPLPQTPAFIHQLKYAGESVADKCRRVLAEIADSGADGLFVSALDEIAWTLNLRGGDVCCNPVTTAFLYLAPIGSTLFIDDVKVDRSVRSYLADNGIAIAPYGAVWSHLASLPGDTRVAVDPAMNCCVAANALGCRMVELTSPIALMKGVKNPIQIEGYREALVRDGVALVGGMMEVEHTLAAGGDLTEIGVADILTRHRAAQPLYFDNSFPTICGYRDHGAIVHYEATEASDAHIRPEGLLLIDSGAQYLDGTTDITRTFAPGTPTAEERHDFTLVLKGHIALARAVFPEGTRGVQLDVLARQFMWREGKTYLHGTGHGVGHFLNVHEGPQNIRTNENPVTLRPGMITSNEPALYVTGKYGIRCENLMFVVADKIGDNGLQFMRFETVTLFPFDRKLIDVSMMEADEIAWLNDYHARVYDALAPHLDDEARLWLKGQTAPL